VTSTEADRAPLPTRKRLLREAMRLFGEHGYAATSIAMIEQAAGLSPGSGSLYKHFASKQELLAEGLDELLRGTEQLTAMLEGTGGAAGPRDADLVATMSEVARAGLARMEQDRDLNRLQFRGLEAFPELMRRFRDEELSRVQRATAELLAALGGDGRDWEAVAAVLVGAVANYWLLRDLYGEHPSGVDEERFIGALAQVAATVLARG
jgi:AcrR family transcriptional regulator